MESEEDIVKNYYSNKDIKNFYKTYWGGESIHIGIYDNDYEKSDDCRQDIKTAIEKKTNLMYYLIKTYCVNDSRKLILADFGSGYGGTSRILYKIFTENKYDFQIDNFDLSYDNCSVNINKNILEDNNISVYNCSFLDIPIKNGHYNAIISEDAFIHISNRDSIFKEVRRVLNSDGFLIFSDIILDHNYCEENIEEVYKRVKTRSLETFRSYRTLAEKNGFRYITSIDYKKSMYTHYSNIRSIIEETEENKKIIEGLNNWIKHTKENNITTKIFVFKKM